MNEKPPSTATASSILEEFDNAISLHGAAGAMVKIEALNRIRNQLEQIISEHGPEVMTKPILRAETSSPPPSWLPIRVQTALSLPRVRPAAECASRAMASGDRMQLQELADALPVLSQQRQASSSPNVHLPTSSPALQGQQSLALPTGHAEEV